MIGLMNTELVFTAKFVHTDYVFTCINTMPISTMWFYANKKYYNYTNILIFDT